MFRWEWDHESIPEGTVTITLADIEADSTAITLDHTCGWEGEGQFFIDGWHFFQLRLGS